MMTPEERAELRRRHWWPGPGWACNGCGHDWPCTTSRLLDALDAAEAEITRMREIDPFVIVERAFSQPAAATERLKLINEISALRADLEAAEAERDAARAQAIALGTLLQKAYGKMDDANAEWGNPSFLCVYCHAMDYDIAVGIVHQQGCIILTMRAVLRALDDKEGR